jgi:hypothetical protein
MYLKIESFYINDNSSVKVKGTRGSGWTLKKARNAQITDKTRDGRRRRERENFSIAFYKREENGKEERRWGVEIIFREIFCVSMSWGRVT